MGDDRRPGLRVRFKRIPGTTPKDVLRTPLRIPAWIGEDFRYRQESAATKFATVSAGEFSQSSAGRRPRKLRTWEGELLTMEWDPIWMTFPDVSPHRVKHQLDQLIDREAPFHFLAIIGPGDRRPFLSCPARLLSIEPRTRRGEVDTVYYALSLEEYRDPSVRRRGHGGEGHGGHGLPAMHQLRDFDTLRSLARHYYGDGANWRLIGRANGITHWGGGDEIVKMKRFHVGDRVKIPKPLEQDSSDVELGDDDAALAVEES